MRYRDIYFGGDNFSLAENRNLLLLFLLWPFLAFLTVLSNYERKESRRLIWFFMVYYGLTFVIANDGLDAARYVQFLKENANLSFSDFWSALGGLYSDTPDIAEPLISFIVSRLTNNHGIYFAVWAAIFGFFYLKSINLLFDRYREQPGWNSLFYLIFFVVLLPVTTINSVRMWTAAWIFFYGAYHVVLFRNPKYLLVTIFSCFVHWSFFSANFILLIYFIAGNRNIIYLPLAFVSFILPQIAGSFFRSVSLRLGGVIQDRFESYTDQTYIIERQESLEQSAWFIQIGNDLVLYFLLFAIIVVQIKDRAFVKGKVEKNLYSFLLLFLSFVNFGKAIPSFGGRFQIVFFLFATLYLFLYSLRLPQRKIVPLTFIGLMPMLLHAAIAFRQGSDTINAWLFAPVLGLPFFVPGVPLSHLLFS